MHLSQKTKQVIFVAFITSLIAAVTSSTLLYFSLRNSSPNTGIPSITNRIKKGLVQTIDEQKEIYNVLIMGYGGAGHAGGTLSDANILASINITDKKVTLTAIPRDLWVKIPERSDYSPERKINYAFAVGNDDKTYPQKQNEFRGRHGGGELAKYVFGKTLGVTIDYYIAIDFDRFKRAIDALEGVDVDVPVSFTDNYFPIPGNEDLLCDFSPEKNKELNDTLSGFELEKQFTCRYETLNFTKGTTHMDGDMALKFIRSRHSDSGGSDFARGERQQAMLEAIESKLISIDAIKNIDTVYEEFRFLVTTDISDSDIVNFIPKIDSNYQDFHIQRLNITNDNLLQSSRSSDGQAILIPKAGDQNFSEIQKYIRENI